MDKPNVFQLSTLADVVAMAPYLLGYHPDHSLVVLGHQAGRLTFALATALPDTTEFTAQAHRITAVLDSKGFTAAFLIGYGPQGQVEAAVDETIDSLQAVDIEILAAARVDDGLLWHLHCEGEQPCPPLAFDPRSTTIAAEATVAGIVALPDREAVLAGLAPITGTAWQAMSAALDDAFDQVADMVLPMTGDPGQAVSRLEALTGDLFGKAITAAHTGEQLDDKQAALLLVLLAVPQVRDAVARHVTDEDVHLRAWTDLTRRAGLTLAHGPAVLLALAALQAGKGVLANAALRRALAAEPGDEFAASLLQAVQLGIDSDAVRGILRG